MDAGDGAVDYFLRIAAEADAGDYFMIAAGEQTKHAQCVRLVARLFEDVFVYYYYSVAR